MKTNEWGALAHLLSDEDTKLMDMNPTTEIQAARFILLAFAKVCTEMGYQALQTEEKELKESIE